MRILGLLVALCLWIAGVQAQEDFIVDAPVSNTKVTTTELFAGRVSTTAGGLLSGTNVHGRYASFTALTVGGVAVTGGGGGGGTSGTVNSGVSGQLAIYVDTYGISGTTASLTYVNNILAVSNTISTSTVSGTRLYGSTASITTVNAAAVLTGLLSVSGTNPSPVSITTSDNGAEFGPQLSLVRESASPASLDDLGALSFLGRNASSSLVNYASVTAVISDPTTGSEDSYYRFRVMYQGKPYTRMFIGPDSVYVSNSLTLTDNFTDGGGDPTAYLWRNSSSPAAGDTLGVISFDGNDDAAERSTYASIHAAIVDPSDTTIDGELRFRTQINGFIGNRMAISSTMGLTVDAKVLNVSATGNIQATGLISGSTVSGTFVNANQLSATTASVGSLSTGAIAATGNITGSPLISTSAAGIVSGGYVYGGLLSGTNVFGTTISTTGANGVISGTRVYAATASNTATYSGIMREGVLLTDATTATTTLNMGAATMISTSLQSNTTVTTTNVNYTQANVLVWKACQDGTGGRTITWPSNARFNANTSPTLSTTANTCNVCNLMPMPGSSNIFVSCPATGVSAT